MITNLSGIKGEKGLTGEPGKCRTSRSPIQNDFPIFPSMEFDHNHDPVMPRYIISKLRRFKIPLFNEPIYVLTIIKMYFKLYYQFGYIFGMWKRDGGCLCGYPENGSQTKTTLEKSRT